jgi:hypothetical protein
MWFVLQPWGVIVDKNGPWNENFDLFYNSHNRHNIGDNNLYDRSHSIVQEYKPQAQMSYILSYIKADTTDKIWWGHFWDNLVHLGQPSTRWPAFEEKLKFSSIECSLLFSKIRRWSRIIYNTEYQIFSDSSGPLL